MNHRVVPAALIISSLLVLSACASASRVTPAVTIEQLSVPEDLRVYTASGFPVEFRATIDNPLEQPVTLVSIEVETVGSSGGYLMRRVRHAFSRDIQAKATDTVDFRAWVQPLSRDTAGDVTGPVMLRGTARFQTPNGLLRTNFVTHRQQTSK